MKQNAEIWRKAMTIADVPLRDARETAHQGETAKNLPPHLQISQFRKIPPPPMRSARSADPTGRVVRLA